MGALPKRCTIDDVIGFPDEAATWLGLPVAWVKKRKRSLPGVINETNKVSVFHPRTYLDQRLRRLKKS